MLRRELVRKAPLELSERACIHLSAPVIDSCWIAAVARGPQPADKILTRGLISDQA